MHSFLVRNTYILVFFSLMFTSVIQCIDVWYNRKTMKHSCIYMQTNNLGKDES